MAYKIGQPTLINGVAFTHSDFKILFLGQPMIEVINFDYAEPMTMEQNHGTGQKVTSVGFGVLKPVATMTVSMKEYRKLVDSAPGRKIQGYPFSDIIVYCGNEDGFYVDRLLKTKWKGHAMSSSVDSTQTEVTLELFVSDIDNG